MCDHLLVELAGTSEVIGTYRLQTGVSAAAKLGYYSAQEFDFAPFAPLRSEIVELGRACVHSDIGISACSGCFGQGIASYAREHGCRYLIGCSSLTSQNPVEGAVVYAQLSRKHLVAPALRTLPLPALACPLKSTGEPVPKVPKLLAAYLSLGAKICGPPAIDREFKTIDFLTFMDLTGLSERTVTRYLS